MLIFVARVAPSAAIGMSLAIVGATSLAASYAYHRRGLVRFRVAVLFGSSGILTALVGARLSRAVSGDLLMLSFGALMVLVGGWMLIPARQAQSTGPGSNCDKPRRARKAHAVLAGAAVGGITGFLGVGGGFLVVPALIAFTGLGFALFVIAVVLAVTGSTTMASGAPAEHGARTVGKSPMTRTLSDRTGSHE